MKQLAVSGVVATAVAMAAWWLASAITTAQMASWIGLIAGGTSYIITNVSHILTAWKTGQEIAANKRKNEQEQRRVIIPEMDYRWVRDELGIKPFITGTKEDRSNRKGA
jgi:hypothetical protein